MLRHPASIRHLCLYTITLMILGMLCLLWSIESGVPAYAHADGRQSLLAAPPANCPDAKPVVKNVAPSLDFCSPKYGGNVAGPVGTHLLLLAENFSQAPTYWFLTQRKIATDADLQLCLSASQSSCRRLPPLSHSSQPQAGMTLYPWTWNNVDFPTTPADYYFVAVLGSQPPFQTVVSSVAFTLLDTQPPCLSVSTGSEHRSADCTQKQTLSLTMNSTITLTGTHWRLGWTDEVATTEEAIHVQAQCRPQAQCSRAMLFDETITKGSVDKQGTFEQSLILPKNVTGTYILTASNQIAQIATPGAAPATAINTVAEGSLTFGMDTDSTGLTLQVIPANNGSSSTSNGSSAIQQSNVSSQFIIQLLTNKLVPWIAAIPSLIALLIFGIQRRSAVVSWWKNKRTTQKEKTSVNPVGNTPPASEQQGKSDREEYGSDHHQPPLAPENRAVLLSAVPPSQPNISISQQQIEMAIEALMNNRLEPALQITKQALLYDDESWNTLRKALAQLPRSDASFQLVKSEYDTLKKRAQDTGYLRSLGLDDMSRALLYSLWYLNFLSPKSIEAAQTWFNVSFFYMRFAQKLDTSMKWRYYTAALTTCYVALEIYESIRDGASQHIFLTLNRLADIHIRSLPFCTDQLAQLHLAICCYEKAIRQGSADISIRSRAVTYHNLSKAYHVLYEITVNKDDLQQARHYAQNASEIFTEHFPLEQRLTDITSLRQEIESKLHKLYQ